MTNKHLYSIRSLIILFIFVVAACAPEKDKTKEVLTEDDNQGIVSDNEATKEGLNAQEKIIFYDVPSPVEMAAMLERLNSPFYADLLSPLDDIDKYYSASSQALILGIYGVDLGYIKLHDQTQEAIRYLAAVKKMTRKIGIPQEETKRAFEILEKGEEDKDILLNIMSETFTTADLYLKQNDRNSSAALILLGGWLEALHIAIKIYEREGGSGGDMLNRIAEQKFSLNTIIELLSKNQYDTVVAKYLDKLLLLKKIYDDVEITFRNSAVEIDTLEKVITLNNQSEIKMTEEQIKNITTIVTNLRKTIIEFS